MTSGVYVISRKILDDQVFWRERVRWMRRLATKSGKSNIVRKSVSSLERKSREKSFPHWRRQRDVYNHSMHVCFPLTCRCLESISLPIGMCAMWVTVTSLSFTKAATLSMTRVYRLVSATLLGSVMIFPLSWEYLLSASMKITCTPTNVLVIFTLLSVMGVIPHFFSVACLESNLFLRKY